MVAELIKRLERLDHFSNLGFGPDHLSDCSLQWPLAYAGFTLYASNMLSGCRESEKFRSYCVKREFYSSTILTCLYSLFELAKLSHGPGIGFGIPVERDTFRLGVPTRPFVPMLVPSAFGIYAIVDALQIDLETDGKRQLVGRLAREVAKTFLVHAKYSDAEQSWIGFSTRNDHNYPVVNANALFAGALASLATLEEVGSYREYMLEVSHKLVGYIENQVRYKSGTPYWHYYGHFAPDINRAQRENDLLHESYTWYGLQRYYEVTHDLEGLQFVRSNVRSSVKRFIHDTHVGELPLDYIGEQVTSGANDLKLRRLNRRARLWSLAAALGMLGRVYAYREGESVNTDLAGILHRQISDVKEFLKGHPKAERYGVICQPRHYSLLLWGLDLPLHNWSISYVRVS